MTRGSATAQHGNVSHPVDSGAASGSGPAILGLDNVRLELPLAGVGSRSLAALVDHVLLSVLQMVVFLGGVTAAGMLEVGGAWGIAIVGLGIFLLQWGYFAAFEIALDGRTPGKVAVGLRTVSSRGGRSAAAALLIRNLFRPLDFLVGVPLLIFDRRHRRLGDLVAGTLVVYHPAPGSGEYRLRRHPASWGAREVAVVEGFLRRAPYLEPERARRLADRLLRWLAREEPELWVEVAPTLPASADRVLTLRRVVEAGAVEAGG